MPKAGSLILIHFLKPLEEGATVSRREYPLHLTVLQWFNPSGVSQESIYKSVSEVSKKSQPFQFTVAGEAMFGPENDVRVNLVNKSPELKNLHLSFANIVEELGAIIESDYIKDSYNPHISHTGKLQSNPGDKYILDSITILQLLEDKTTCKAIKNFSFGG